MVWAALLLICVEMAGLAGLFGWKLALFGVSAGLFITVFDVACIWMFQRGIKGDWS